MLKETFDEPCDGGLSTLKCHLVDLIAGYIQNAGTTAVSDSRSDEHFNLHLKLSSKRSLQRKRKIDGNGRHDR